MGAIKRILCLKMQLFKKMSENSSQLKKNSSKGVGGCVAGGGGQSLTDSFSITDN